MATSHSADRKVFKMQAFPLWAGLNFGYVQRVEKSTVDSSLSSYLEVIHAS